MIADFFSVVCKEILVTLGYFNVKNSEEQRSSTKNNAALYRSVDETFSIMNPCSN